MFDVLHSQLIPGLKEASYNNHKLSRLMYADDISDREMLNGMEYLDDLLLSYPLINSLYIYNGQMNYFLSTSKGLEQTEDFFDREVLNIVRKFDHNLIDRYWPRIATKQISYTETEEGPVLTLLMGTTPENSTPLKGALISNIDVLELQYLLNTRYGSGNDEIFIINHQGEWICQSLDDSDVDIESIFSSVSQLDEMRGILTTPDNQLVTYQFNHRLGWYFIGIMPLDHINAELFRVSRTIILILIGLLVLSVLLSYMATRRVYKPIDSLMHIVTVEDNSNLDFSIGEDNRELSFIADRYKSILNEKTSLEDSLEDLQDDYRLEIFRSIIDGQEYQYWEDELHDEDMDFLRNPLSLFLIQIDNYYRIAEEMKPEVFRALRKTLVREIQESLKDNSPVLVDMDVRNLICLVSGSPEISIPLMKALQDSVRKNLTCTISISWTHRQNHEELKLKQMYPRALSAVGGKFAFGFNQLIAYSNQDQSTLIFPGDLADKLFQHMRKSDLSGALNKLEELGLILKKGTYQDFIQHIRILSYRILRFLKEKDLMEIQKLLQQIRSYPETLETLQNFSGVFRDILKTIHKQLDVPDRKGLAHFQLIENQLKKQYKDPNCCVQSLADELAFSPNYLRQIYKNLSGNSLSHIIIQMRVDEACRLLSETSSPVKEIYGPSGFTNYNSFFTSFRKIKGKTPVEYRRTERNR